jgi:hypothetical protein
MWLILNTGNDKIGQRFIGLDYIELRAKARNKLEAAGGRDARD